MPTGGTDSPSRLQREMSQLLPARLLRWRGAQANQVQRRARIQRKTGTLAYLQSCRKHMSHAATTLLLLLHCGIIFTALALPQYQSAIPNGAFFGALTGHSSTSGGSRYAQLRHCAV
jgi:hypothetical protein